MSSDPIRDEAERLVAAAMAAVSMAARGLRPADGPGLSTGGPECCVCPVCRVIAAMRDPDPELAERLATGAGDFATGVASLLRAFATGRDDAMRPPPDTDPPDRPSPSATAEGDEFWEALRQRAAADGEAPEPTAPNPGTRKPMARKAVAKKAVARKATAKKAPAGEATATTISHKPDGSGTGQRSGTDIGGVA